MTEIKLDIMTATIAVTLFALVTGFLYLLLSQIRLSGDKAPFTKGHSTQILTRKNEKTGEWVDSKIHSYTSPLPSESAFTSQAIRDVPWLKSMSSYSFRISDIPSSISEPQLRTFLEELGLTDGEKRDGDNVLILSMAKSSSGTDSTRYQVATVTFRQVPEVLLSSISQSETVSVSISTSGKSTEVNFDSHFLGLTPLFSAQNPTVDIIAVTGLAGHAFGSWKARGGVKMWLRDFLPEDLSQDGYQVRILTYGYDSTLVGSASDASIHEFARRLLEAVKDSRCQPNEDHRPIIFIAHSLGGLVLKHALTEAAQGDSRDTAIFRSCYAALFFGVPNRGLLNSHLVSMVRGQPNAHLVRDLGEKSQFLPQIHREFQRQFVFQDAKIYSFYESKDTPSVVYNPLTMRYERTGPLVRMVTRDSATYSGPNEKIYQQLNIDADHSDIVKFGSRSNFDYMTVRSKIRECLEEAPRAIKRRFPDQREKTPAEKQCLRSLLPTGINPTPKTPRVRLHPGTCEWLLGHESFNEWRLSQNNASRFFWIHGNPGTGKTVLMNFLREQLATDSKSRIAYFFCDDEDVNNRTAIVVLKSLLYQLLDQNPGLFPHILPENKMFRLDEEQNWSVAALWDAFRKIVIDPAAESVYCVVDALDQCLDDQSGNDYSRSDLLRDLHDLYLSESSRCIARIVISSRPVPQIQSLLPNIRIVIRLEDFNRSDIGRYISDEVDRLAIKVKYPPSLKKEVQTAIEGMSGNMFLWVSLILKELSKLRTTRQIRRLLNTAPRTLFAYYESILESIPSENINQAKILLMWIMYAATPIRLEELSLVMAVRDDARSIAEIEEDIPLNIEGDIIMELCSPLVEIVDSCVVVIHRTVKDFLVTASDGMDMGNPPLEPRYHIRYSD